MGKAFEDAGIPTGAEERTAHPWYKYAIDLIKAKTPSGVSADLTDAQRHQVWETYTAAIATAKKGV